MSARTEELEAGSDGPLLPPARILVVDDRPTSRAVVKGVLNSSAYVDAPPRFLCELIEREVNAFQGGERSDDLTLLMLRRNS